jgi:hypothetical protein
MRIVALLGIDLHRVDRALARLLELGLVTHRPWRSGHPDGVWQLLPMPTPADPPPNGGVMSAADVLRRLGLRDQ